MPFLDCYDMYDSVTLNEVNYVNMSITTDLIGAASNSVDYTIRASENGGLCAKK